MGVHLIRLPDIGEGIAEAELTEWHVGPGDVVREDDLLAVVMTDKAAVEVPSSVDGTVLELGADIGEAMAVGSVLIRIEVDGEGNEAEAAGETVAPPDIERTEAAPAVEAQTSLETGTRHSEPIASPPRAPAVARAQGTKPLASPSVRMRARKEGIDLRQVPGSGPASRISHADLDHWISAGGILQGRTTRGPNTGVEEVRVIGMRRRIAEKMQIAKRQIPHITIVEEVEIEALDALREALNKKYAGDRPKLTLLP
ncbi:MAG: biotin/lipoyl-containing protein, partial [Pseudomonadota bacterium]